MFKKGGFLWVLWNLIVAAAFITLGVVTCVQSGNPDFQNIIILIVGILVIVDASLRLLTLALSIIMKTEEEAVRGQIGRAAACSSELAVGILLILVSRGESAYLTVLFQYLAYFLGILLITMGAVAILFGVVFLVKKVATLAYNIFAFIVGALLVTGGVLVLVYANQEALLQLFFIFFGIILILVGIVAVFATVAFLIHARNLKKAVANGAPAEENVNVIDAEAVVAEEKKEEPKEEPKEAPSEEEPKPEDGDKPE